MNRDWRSKWRRRGSGAGAMVALAVALWPLGVQVRAEGPRTARAEARIEAGYVLGLTLTDPGAAYGVPPSVTLSGGGGSGATAVAQVRNGVVESVLLVTAGSGYTSEPAVEVAAPLEPMLESAQRRIRLAIRGLVGDTQRILVKNDFATGQEWTERTNVLVTHSPYVWEDTTTSARSFYRVAGAAQTPRIESAGLCTRLTIRTTPGTRNWILGTDLSQPHVWRVLAEVVAPTAVYAWIDEEAQGAERRYQVAAAATVPVEMDPRRWVWLQPGRFIMGSPPDERGRWSVEGPETLVTLTQGLWLGRHEVTQREFVAVMGNNPSSATSDLDRPVESVSWHDATNYCGTLTTQEQAAGRLPAGYEYRLPTEAQWEYACRAGTTMRYSFGAALECDDHCGACIPAAPYMWWCGNSREQCHPVGQTLPNPWGLYDMHGNVYEWCQDRWAASLPGGSLADPTGPGSGTDRVLRGGSWYDLGQYCRSAARGGNWPAIGSNLLGFRAALVTVP